MHDFAKQKHGTIATGLPERSSEGQEPSTEKTEPSTEKPDKKPGSQVKTGDDTPIILISVLLGVSLLGVGIVIVLKRKNKKDD